MLKTSKNEVQYRVDARIPEYGPFATAPLIQGGTERVAGNRLITSVLDGVMPEGARKMSVSGVDGRTSAYTLNGLTYLRTPLTLLSPGWEQSVSSADGMNVYALSQTPVLLLSDNGRFVRANVNNAKGLSDE
jgi:intracellular multiplication protein IcmK